jgi:hypothetical protein
MVLIYGCIPWITLIPLFFACIHLLIKGFPRPAAQLCVLYSLASAGISFICFTSAHRDAAFMEAVSQRVARDIGVAHVRQIATKLKSDVESGRRAGARIVASDLPTELNVFFPDTRISGHYEFTASNTCNAVAVHWGGAFYRWGIVVRFGNDGANRKPGTKSVQLAADVHVQLEQD